MADERLEKLRDPRRVLMFALLVTLGMAPMILEVFNGRTGDLWQRITLRYFPVILAMVGGFVALGLPDQAWRRAAEVAVARGPDFLFHLIFTSVFLADLALLVVFLLFPTAVVSGSSEVLLDVQLLGCIATSGLLGGFIKQLHTTLRPYELSSRSEGPSPHVRFWSTLYSLFSSVFIATVLFMLLRAGVLKTVQVDTFNVYGVTGVAAVSGYLADNIISRFAFLYRELLGPRLRAESE